jgi:beta-galactosidase
MDACDELGIFVIVATPGWQYWGKDPAFEPRVMQNTRDMIRRDRNHPSVLMWEPILNETPFPEDFALKSLQVTRAEYPYPWRLVAAADLHSAGVRDHYDLVYGWRAMMHGPTHRGRTSSRASLRVCRRLVIPQRHQQACRAWERQPMLTSLVAGTDRLDHHRPRTVSGGLPVAPLRPSARVPSRCLFRWIYMPSGRRRRPSRCLLPNAGWATRWTDGLYRQRDTQFSDSNVVVFSNCDSVRSPPSTGTQLYARRASSCDKAFNAPVIFRKAWTSGGARVELQAQEPRK